MTGYRRPVEAGLQFLLSIHGDHERKGAHSPAGYGMAIVGWPWIAQTHSWIEPTCLSMLALKAHGLNNHPRTREAARMVMNHQLSGGGWNYGNLAVFGRPQRPIPENTGQALCALDGMTTRISIEISLDYLFHCLHRVRDPMAVTWMLYGLGMWSKLPLHWKDIVVETLELQEQYGSFDTVLLSQLAAVYFTQAKLTSIFN